MRPTDDQAVADGVHAGQQLARAFVQRALDEQEPIAALASIDAALVSIAAAAGYLKGAHGLAIDSLKDERTRTALKGAHETGRALAHAVHRRAIQGNSVRPHDHPG